MYIRKRKSFLQYVAFSILSFTNLALPWTIFKKIQPKMFPCTRRMQFWKPCRKSFDQSSKTQCSMSQTFYKIMITFQIFFPNCFFRRVKSSFDNPPEKFLLKVRVFFKQVQKKILVFVKKLPRVSHDTQNALLTTLPTFTKIFLWTRKKQFWKRCQKFLVQSQKKFAPISQKIINFFQKKTQKVLGDMQNAVLTTAKKICSKSQKKCGNWLFFSMNFFPKTFFWAPRMELWHHELTTFSLKVRRKGIWKFSKVFIKFLAENVRLDT